MLKDNKCFGLRRRQIFIVQQGAGVPALSDNEAKIATDPNDPYRVLTKPHGHGDIHTLLHKEGITKKWEESFGIKYLVIFQVSHGTFY
jgi:UDP-sugar pyrophosphorylase